MLSNSENFEEIWEIWQEIKWKFWTTLISEFQVKKSGFFAFHFQLHLLCFISNAVSERPVDKSQNFDGVAYIA